MHLSRKAWKRRLKSEPMDGEAIMDWKALDTSTLASLLDRWWLGIHQGAIHPSHLAYYLDEFTFRFNRRRSKARGMLFFRLLEAAVDCDPVPRKKIIGGDHSI